MVFSKSIDINFLNEIGKNSMSGYLDIEFLEVHDNYLIASMPVDHRTKQPMGLLHGGASVVLAETVGSVASVCVCQNPLQDKVVGIEINANHLRSVKEGKVYAKVSPIKIGKSLHVWNIEISNESNEMICISRLTTMIIPKSD